MGKRGVPAYYDSFCGLLACVILAPEEVDWSDDDCAVLIKFTGKRTIPYGRGRHTVTRLSRVVPRSAIQHSKGHTFILPHDWQVVARQLLNRQAQP